MAVKELIELYESPTRPKPRASALQEPSSTSTATLATLAPTPARFLPRYEIPASLEAPSSPSTSGTLGSDTSKLGEVDIAEPDSPLTPYYPSRPFLSRTSKKHSTIRFEAEEEKEELVPHSYPPANQRPRIISTNTATTWSSTRSHIPVPATTVFARNAAPLYLPKLDQYLASLPKPEFLEDLKSKEDPPEMFPPMERLAKSKMSLDDMEANTRRIPFWRNRKTILGSTINIVIGFLVRGVWT